MTSTTFARTPSSPAQDMLDSLAIFPFKKEGRLGDVSTVMGVRIPPHAPCLLEQTNTQKAAQVRLSHQDACKE